MNASLFNFLRIIRENMSNHTQKYLGAKTWLPIGFTKNRKRIRTTTPASTVSFNTTNSEIIKILQQASEIFKMGTAAVTVSNVPSRLLPNSKEVEEIFRNITATITLSESTNTSATLTTTKLVPNKTFNEASSNIPASELKSTITPAPKTPTNTEISTEAVKTTVKAVEEATNVSVTLTNKKFQSNETYTESSTTESASEVESVITPSVKTSTNIEVSTKIVKTTVEALEKATTVSVTPTSEKFKSIETFTEGMKSAITPTEKIPTSTEVSTEVIKTTVKAVESITTPTNEKSESSGTFTKGSTTTLLSTIKSVLTPTEKIPTNTELSTKAVKTTVNTVENATSTFATPTNEKFKHKKTSIEGMTVEVKTATTSTEKAPTKTKLSTEATETTLKAKEKIKTEAIPTDELHNEIITTEYNNYKEIEEWKKEQNELLSKMATENQGTNVNESEHVKTSIKAQFNVQTSKTTILSNHTITSFELLSSTQKQNFISPTGEVSSTVQHMLKTGSEHSKILNSTTTERGTMHEELSNENLLEKFSNKHRLESSSKEQMESSSKDFLTSSSFKASSKVGTLEIDSFSKFTQTHLKKIELSSTEAGTLHEEMLSENIINFSNVSLIDSQDKNREGSSKAKEIVPISASVASDNASNNNISGKISYPLSAPKENNTQSSSITVIKESSFPESKISSLATEKATSAQHQQFLSKKFSPSTVETGTVHEEMLSENIINFSNALSVINQNTSGKTSQNTDKAVSTLTPLISVILNDSSTSVKVTVPSIVIDLASSPQQQKNLDISSKEKNTISNRLSTPFAAKSSESSKDLHEASVHRRTLLTTGFKNSLKHTAFQQREGTVTEEVLDENNLEHFSHQKKSTLCEICDKPANVVKSHPTDGTFKHTAKTNLVADVSQEMKDEDVLEHFSHHHSSTLCENCDGISSGIRPERTTSLLPSNANVTLKNTVSTKLLPSVSSEMKEKDIIEHFPHKPSSTLCEKCKGKTYASVTEPPTQEVSLEKPKTYVLNNEGLTSMKPSSFTVFQKNSNTLESNLRPSEVIKTTSRQRSTKTEMGLPNDTFIIHSTATRIKEASASTSIKENLIVPEYYTIEGGTSETISAENKHLLELSSQIKSENENEATVKISSTLANEISSSKKLSLLTSADMNESKAFIEKLSTLAGETSSFRSTVLETFTQIEKTGTEILFATVHNNLESSANVKGKTHIEGESIEASSTSMSEVFSSIATSLETSSKKETESEATLSGEILTASVNVRIGSKSSIIGEETLFKSPSTEHESVAYGSNGTPLEASSTAKNKHESEATAEVLATTVSAATGSKSSTKEETSFETSSELKHEGKASSSEGILLGTLSTAESKTESSNTKKETFFQSSSKPESKSEASGTLLETLSTAEGKNEGSVETLATTVGATTEAKSSSTKEETSFESSSKAESEGEVSGIRGTPLETLSTAEGKNKSASSVEALATTAGVSIEVKGSSAKEEISFESSSKAESVSETSGSKGTSLETPSTSENEGSVKVLATTASASTEAKGSTTEEKTSFESSSEAIAENEASVSKGIHLQMPSTAGGKSESKGSVEALTTTVGASIEVKGSSTKEETSSESSAKPESKGEASGTPLETLSTTEGKNEGSVEALATTETPFESSLKAESEGEVSGTKGTPLETSSTAEGKNESASSIEALATTAGVSVEVKGSSAKEEISFESSSKAESISETSGSKGTSLETPLTAENEESVKVLATTASASTEAKGSTTEEKTSFESSSEAIGESEASVSKGIHLKTPSTARGKSESEDSVEALTTTAGASTEVKSSSTKEETSFESSAKPESKGEASGTPLETLSTAEGKNEESVKALATTETPFESSLKAESEGEVSGTKGTPLETSLTAERKNESASNVEALTTTAGVSVEVKGSSAKADISFESSSKAKSVSEASVSKSTPLATPFATTAGVSVEAKSSSTKETSFEYLSETESKGKASGSKGNPLESSSTVEGRNKGEGSVETSVTTASASIEAKGSSVKEETYSESSSEAESRSEAIGPKGTSLETSSTAEGKNEGSVEVFAATRASLKSKGSSTREESSSEISSQAESESEVSGFKGTPLETLSTVENKNELGSSTREKTSFKSSLGAGSESKASGSKDTVESKNKSEGGVESVESKSSSTRSESSFEQSPEIESQSKVEGPKTTGLGAASVTEIKNNSEENFVILGVTESKGSSSKDSTSFKSSQRAESKSTASTEILSTFKINVSVFKSAVMENEALLKSSLQGEEKSNSVSTDVSTKEELLLESTVKPKGKSESEILSMLQTDEADDFDGKTNLVSLSQTMRETEGKTSAEALSTTVNLEKNYPSESQATEKVTQSKKATLNDVYTLVNKEQASFILKSQSPIGTFTNENSAPHIVADSTLKHTVATKLLSVVSLEEQEENIMEHFSHKQLSTICENCDESGKSTNLESFTHASIASKFSKVQVKPTSAEEESSIEQTATSKEDNFSSFESTSRSLTETSSEYKIQNDTTLSTANKEQVPFISQVVAETVSNENTTVTTTSESGTLVSSNPHTLEGENFGSSLQSDLSKTQSVKETEESVNTFTKALTTESLGLIYGTASSTEPLRTEQEIHETVVTEKEEGEKITLNATSTKEADFMYNLTETKTSTEETEKSTENELNVAVEKVTTVATLLFMNGSSSLIPKLQNDNLTTSEIHIDLPIYLSNSSKTPESFLKFYTAEMSTVIVDDEATDATISNDYKRMSVDDFNFVTEFPLTTEQSEGNNHSHGGSEENISTSFGNSISTSYTTTKLPLNNKLITDVELTFPSNYIPNGCSTSDYQNGNGCFCLIDEILKRLNHASRDKELPQKVDSFQCESFFKVKEGLLINNETLENRVKRSYFFLKYQKELGVFKRETVPYNDIEHVLKGSTNIHNTESTIYAVPGTKVLIPCLSGDITETEGLQNKYSWTSSGGRPLTEGKVQEKGGVLSIENLTAQDGGNYTCKIITPTNENEISRDHQLIIIDLPTYSINTHILYNITKPCNLTDVDLMSSYLPSSMKELLCGVKCKFCDVKIRKPHCTQINEKPYMSLYITVILQPLKSILPSIRPKLCDINCQMHIYSKIASTLVKNVLNVEAIPVISKLNIRKVSLFPTQVIKKKGKAEVTQLPELVVACPAGFGFKKSEKICSACLPNTYSSGDESYCTPCAIGEYQPVSGSKSCLSCTSPLQDPACLRIMYSNTKLFRVYVGIGFSTLILIMMLMCCCSSAAKKNEKLNINDKHRRHYKSEFSKGRRSRNPDVEQATEPLLLEGQKRHKRPVPPKPPPPDFF